MKYKKKPVVVDAWRCAHLLIDATNNWKDLPAPVREAYESSHLVFAADHILIRTLEGVMTAQKNDFVVRGIKGEFYPCKPDIFHASYEAAEL